VKRKIAIVASLFITFGALTTISFFGLATPVHSNPIVVTIPAPTLAPSPSPTPSPQSTSEYLTGVNWGMLLAGYVLTVAVELIFVEWFTRRDRASGKPAWALRWLVLGVNTLTFPITQVLAVIIGTSLGWNTVILAELFPLVAEYIAYRWQIPKLQKSGLFVNVPSNPRLALMTVCANALSLCAGLLLMGLI
jgi:hypothetical protein